MVICCNCEGRDSRSSQRKPDFRVANQTAEQSDVIYIAHGIFPFSEVIMALSAAEGL
jgi:hypothetical protein